MSPSYGDFKIDKILIYSDQPEDLGALQHFQTKKSNIWFTGQFVLNMLLPFSHPYPIIPNKKKVPCSVNSEFADNGPFDFDDTSNGD